MISFIIGFVIGVVLYLAYRSRELYYSRSLKAYIAGTSKHTDLNTVSIAGEDMVENRMMIGIADLPGWIRSGIRFDLKMSQEDIALVKKYFAEYEIK